MIKQIAIVGILGLALVLTTAVASDLRGHMPGNIVNGGQTPSTSTACGHPNVTSQNPNCGAATVAGGDAGGGGNTLTYLPKSGMTVLYF